MTDRSFNLPTLEEAYKPLQKEQLEILYHQLLSEGELISIQSRFNYAWGLIKSQSIEDQRLGVKILTDVFKDSPQRRRECLYYLAIGTFKLGEFAESRRFAETLVAFDPENQQAKVLKKTIEDKITKDGLVGGLMITGVIAAGVAGAAWFFRQSARQRLLQWDVDSVGDTLEPLGNVWGEGNLCAQLNRDLTFMDVVGQRIWNQVV
ncbi:hypothetical protein WICPIJ_001317 [Wickerhamomyces pijperi]|uniref:Mitochondrial fission 1 protein n=1 Tax=Wickerhamomyces pijperi TaxID=599730 RepID=A0A9P8TQW7_WICPI|nr:hypothetical protein WICPIJ_001317 [Wickerhamomyces pijperi]